MFPPAWITFCWSISFCYPPHSLKVNIDGGTSTAVLIADQSFPPVLSASYGKCEAFVRVEDGRFFEVEESFRDIFSVSVSPHGNCRLAVWSWSTPNHILDALGWKLIMSDVGSTTRSSFMQSLTWSPGSFRALQERSVHA
jgi:hypothetical protein